MRWLNENDINLNFAIEVLKSEMTEVLKANIIQHR